ncbi:tetratricopeptide repeat protein [Nostoc edaphicum CCNP1411]|uniref:Tetratricopeptide repeat protein n=1 Tax=Nostoc edaphicum CCNP1411 TaxID=1472755 RepID=A0A7D7QKQ3_9NOSO|nr:tetratricopeptide repeat protein [Nostoc edaphicum]QMS89344.1 tetratricopeptide repeat protein [Nostoc edaphicum CCNP1411]
MNPNLSDWDDDLPPEPEEAYQDLLRALKRKSGFGLFFVQCTPGEADKFIVKLPQEIPQKKIAVLRLVEAIDNLYQPVAEFVKDKQIDILLIKGLEYSLYKYEKRNFGEITEGQFSNLTSVPHILNHLNQQRERFRDDFPITFVFLLRSFSISYFIHRAPDFFDWRSGVFELPTTPEVVIEESYRILYEGEDEEYEELNLEQKIEKLLEIQDLLQPKFQTETRKSILLLELGKLLVTINEYEAALAYYNKALIIQPDFYKLWQERAYVFIFFARYEEAIINYKKALQINSDSCEAWFYRGFALQNLGSHQEAAKSYLQAVKIKPNSYEAWYYRALALMSLGNYKKALVSLEQVLKIKPNFYRAWYSRGLSLERLGQFEEALVSYDQAVKIKPNFLLAWYYKGIVLRNLGRYEDVLIFYERAAKIKPNNYDDWYCQGIILGKLGRYREAIASYNQALKIKPTSHEAWYESSHVLRKLGYYQEAINSFAQAVKNDPNFYKTNYIKIIIFQICKLLLIVVKMLPKLINFFKILLKLMVLRR